VIARNITALQEVLLALETEGRKMLLRISKRKTKDMEMFSAQVSPKFDIRWFKI
jgi:hypothetical protein